MDEIRKCDGSGSHKGWKRGFLLIAGTWRCRVCKAIAQSW